MAIAEEEKESGGDFKDVDREELIQRIDVATDELSDVLENIDWLLNIKKFSDPTAEEVTESTKEKVVNAQELLLGLSSKDK